MTLEARLADIRQDQSFSDHTLLDHGAGETRGPRLVNRAVAVRRRVERVVHHHVELLVRERRLHVAVVGVLRPRGVGEVQDQRVP